MLKGIDHRLNAEVLGCLAAMGHGDVIVLADSNLASDSIARATVTGKLLRMENLSAAEVVQAILSVLPLDPVAEDPAGRIAVDGDAGLIPPVQQEVQAEIDRAEGRPRPMVAIERLAFYDFARRSYAVIQTGERRLWGCFYLRKGVIPPED
jgi:L-fucose mutarotase